MQNWYVVTIYYYNSGADLEVLDDALELLRLRLRPAARPGLRQCAARASAGGRAGSWALAAAPRNR